MGDRIADRAEALGLPWFSRWMRIGTALLAVLLFASQLTDPPSGDPMVVLGVLVSGALLALASAALITTWVKAISLMVRVPLSLYLYPD